MTDVSVLMAAHAVAMRAMINDLDAHAVDDMRTRAEEMACGQAVFRAITNFATQYELVRRDPPALAAEGRTLRDALAATAPAGAAQAMPERRDIDG